MNSIRFKYSIEPMDRSLASFDRMLLQFMARDREQQQEEQRRAHLCALGIYSWYSVYAPIVWVGNHIIDPLTPRQLQHMKERFHRKPKSERATCGAKCRSGEPCRSRVVVRSDGTSGKRCRMHGGLSTGLKSRAGRMAIARSNRRRVRGTRKLEQVGTETSFNQALSSGISSVANC